ncbi:hypothetical protein K1T71_010645 [Dendrolimus kikuchii]|uniref:Uncharacterized protein n=1 Tax=Dendrolimus kikuchii TaxID=765133 RepID=A0ACC1CPU9_9NEOP|nr:hypothetical protein K1T71_010645 [Dendrolimus kikuchii]
MLGKIFALFGLIVLSNGMVSYDNYKVYSVVPSNEVQVQRLTDLMKEGYEFWSEVLVVGQDTRIMVSPEQEKDFVEYSKSIGMEALLKIANVQELIDAQMAPSTIDRSTSLGSFHWDGYHNLSVIHAWLDELPGMYPGIVTPVVIGTSIEGRQIKGVVIDFKAGERGANPLTAMIEGGIHAREWISPATVTWIIKEFLSSNDSDVRYLAETFVWHIFPVTNPDGYEYTFRSNRMWRKNRNPANYIVCDNGDTDIGNGIDLNRNFDFLWMTTGASDNPCSTTYAGPVPSSELEAQSIINYVLGLKQTGNVIYYFAFHSYSQMILIPYSHASGLQVLEASNYADMYEIAIRGAEKLEAVHGTHYQVGTSAEILYEVSGSSFDWVKGVADIPIVYLFELRDVGQFGFLLPKEQIIPNSQEIVACLVEMDKATRDLKYYYSGSTSLVASFTSLLITALLLVVMK